MAFYEDDRHYSGDSDSDSHHYSSDDDSDDCHYSSDDDSDDCHYSGDNFDYDSGDKESATSIQPYTFLNQDDIRRRQEKGIMQTSAALSLPTSSSTLLLVHYNWHVDNLLNSWFADEASIRAAVGLIKHSDYSSKELTCGVCMDTHPHATMSAAACGHHYCDACWSSYIGTSITNGPGCLTLRCPHSSCSSAVDQFMIDKLAASDDRATYSRYLLRSYVESKKSFIKWCPSPDCELAVEFVSPTHYYDMKCRCSYCFCWACTEDAHHPVSCDIVAKWVEEGNKNWVSSYSNECTKCKGPVDKILCTGPFGLPCHGDRSKHSSKMCGFFDFAGEMKKRRWEESELKRRGSYTRYQHYYMQWSMNHRIMMEGLERLRELKEGRLNELTRMLHGETWMKLVFILDAWAQIVKCSRVLKWSYAYGYFLDVTRGERFDNLQHQVESELMLLFRCASELKQFFRSNHGEEDVLEEFKGYRNGLTKHMSVTAAQLNNLVPELEIELHVTPETETENDAGSSYLYKEICQSCTFNLTDLCESVMKF